MHTYTVKVTCEQVWWVTVEAETEEEAIKKGEEEASDIAPLDYFIESTAKLKRAHVAPPPGTNQGD
ncbi:MAG: hypothetical protein Q8R07_06185 [Candidatus Uhrbacteria bacterium]|nr:hypothetical protein [Candidatus Uhrbacteria bacterium]